MNEINQRNRTLAIFFLRGLLGLIFLMQGYGKVFSWGVQNVYNTAFKAYEDTFIPDFVLWLTAYYTSYAELICGFLLLIGLFRNPSLYILGSVLLIVDFGHGLTNPIWELEHVLFRAMLLIPLLLLPAQWDRLTIDYHRVYKNQL